MSQMKVLLPILALLALLAYSCEAGPTGPDYGNVSVEKVDATAITGSFSGRDVQSREDFEANLLQPLMSVVSQEMPGSPLGSLTAMNGTTGNVSLFPRAMEEIINKQGSDTQTIDLSLQADSPFDSGILTTNGSYRIFGQSDNAAQVANFNASMNVKTSLANGQITQRDSLGLTQSVVAIAGDTNVNALADFNLSANQTSPTSGTLDISMGYGIALSSAYYIDVDDRTMANEDIGALVTLDLKFSLAISKSYIITQPDDADQIMADLQNDLMPDNASIEISVYASDGTLVFTETYGKTEIMSLIQASSL